MTNPTVHAIGPRDPQNRKSYSWLFSLGFIGLGLALGSMGGGQLGKMAAITYSDWNTVKDTPAIQLPTPQWSMTEDSSIWMQAAWELQDEQNHDPTAYDVMRLFEKMELSPVAAMTVSSNLVVAQQQYIITVDDPVLRSTLETPRQEAVQWLEKTWEDIQQQMLSGDTISIEPNTNAIKVFEAEGGLDHFLALPNAKQKERVESFLIRPLLGLYSSPIDVAKDQSLDVQNVERSRIQLMQAVKNSGLAALVVNETMYNNPYFLKKFAQSLTAFNRDLQILSGWDGQVLGLNQRVVLDNGFYNQNGRAFIDGGYIRINASWDTLGHEWYHALDYANMRFTRGHSTKTVLSSANSMSWFEDKDNLHKFQSQLLKGFEEVSLSPQQNQQFMETMRTRNQKFSDGDKHLLFWALNQSSLEAATKGAPEKGSPWLYYRNRASDIAATATLQNWSSHSGETMSEQQWAVEQEHVKDYIQRSSELLAFSFQSFIEVKRKTTPLAVASGEMDQHPGSYMLSDVEASLQAPLWDKYFANLSPWWNTDTAARHPVQLKTKLQRDLSLPSLPTAGPKK